MKSIINSIWSIAKIILLISVLLIPHNTFSQNINEKIIFAAARGELDTLNKFLTNDSVDIRYTYENGYNAFDFAIERNKISTFIRLAKYFSFEYNNSIYSHGVVDQSDSNFNTLVIAVLNNDLRQTKELLIKGVNPNTKHISGYYPISLAVRWEFIEMTRLLLKYNAQINCVNTNRYNTTPLIELSRNGNVAIAKILISKGARINEVDINNDPAINWATFFGHLNFVKFLLHNGARTDLAGTDSGDNALAIARRMKFVEIENVLIKHK